MKDSLKVSVFQMQSTDDIDENLSIITDQIGKSGNAEMCVFPEYSMLHPDYSRAEEYIGSAQDLDGSFLKEIRDASKKNNRCTLVNFIEKSAVKPYNSSVYINNQGLIGAHYAKLHLFDAGSYRESLLHQQGEKFPEPVLMAGVPSGIEICYDIRFPELSRLLALQGSMVQYVMAGFYAGNLKYHTWKTLLAARAMENGTYVVASAQCGPEFTGHSMIIAPDGEILQEAGDDPASISADLSMKRVLEYRESMGVINHRRRDLYGLYGF